MTPSKPRVLVIFPKYQPNDHTHYPYWYQLFDAVKYDLDLTVFVESPTSDTLPENFFTQKIAAKPFNLIERYFTLRHLVRQHHIQHVYIHYSFWSTLIAKLLKITHPMTIYVWQCERYRFNPTDPRISWLLKLADITVTGSKVIANAYQAMVNKNLNIKIVPNWVDVPTKRSKNTNIKDIVFLHHLSPRKGSRELPTIIKGLSQLPYLRFHLIGDGPDRPWLQDQLSQQKAQITWYGYLPHKKALEVVASSNLLIMPSRQEGFPRVILEAMANRIPFVATEVGNVKELAGKLQQDYIVPIGKPYLFIKAVTSITKTASLSKLIDQNYQHTKQYTLDIASNAFIKLFIQND